MNVRPSEWLSVKIEDVVEILDALRVPVNNTERLERIEGKNMEDLYPYYGATGEVGKIDAYIFDEELVALGEDGVPFLDPLKNKAYLLVGKTWVNNHAHVLKGWGKCFSNRFLLHYLNQFDYHGYVNGGTRLKLTQASMRKIPTPLTSIFEQKEIADRLDILLAQVEATQARLASIPYIIKQFRQSVLAAAVSGKLTEEWRIKHANTPWLDGVLGDFINKPTYGSSAKSDKDGLVPVLRMGNLQNGKLDWTELVYTSDEVEIEKYKLKTGDVLFNRTNSPELVGKTSIYRGERTAIYAGYLIKISCLPVLNPEFLNYHLNSPSARAYCYAVKSDGVSQSNINAKKLAEYPMLLPQPAEQTEIVRRVEQLFAYADTIEQQAKAAKARVDNLTQAILAKAFRGELTADWRAANPDLISGDHSAEALLAKINSERKAMKLANKSTGGKPKAKKNHQPQKNSDSAVINLINKKGITKPQDIFNELKAYMDLRDVLKEISQLLDQNLIREVDIDGQKHLEINR